MDKLLIFDIKGKMAHFRPFYTNSSSLSYTFPPRTTIAGLIAGILGIPSERFEPENSYYEDFYPEKCKIALSVMTPLRKIIQTVNYVQTKKSEGGIKVIDGSAGSTQIPLEIVLPQEKDEYLCYRIYFYHTDELFEKLQDCLKNKRWVYPPYLGISEFLADIEFIDSTDKVKPVEGDKEVKIKSVVNMEYIELGNLKFTENTGKPLRYIKERMPIIMDRERKLKKIGIYEMNYGEIIAQCKNVYEIQYRKVSEPEYIVFME